MSRALGWAGLVGAAIVVFSGCVGDDPITSNPADPGVDSGAVGDGSVPTLAPDAAPPANCPLECLPPAPPGWTGPSAMYDGPAATKPAACPTPYTLPEIDAHRNAVAAAAACSCGTPTFVGAKCAANIELWSTSACNAGLPLLEGSVAAPNASCAAISNGSQQGMRVTTPTLSRGTCTFAAPSKVLPPPSFEAVQVACGLPQVASCQGRADCVASPIPAAPFTRLCIHKDGDESCPSADYAKRSVAFKKLDDSRACSACTGAPAGGACGNKWGLTGTLAMCNVVTPPTSMQANVCGNNPGIGAVVNINAMAPTGITCTPSGGEATGVAKSAEPVTLCCNR